MLQAVKKKHLPRSFFPQRQVILAEVYLFYSQHQILLKITSICIPNNLLCKNMKDHFRKLVLYNKSANESILRAFQSEVPGEANLSVFSHILNAHKIWISRINLKAPVIGVWDLQTITEMQNINDRNHLETEQLLEDADLDSEIKYRTFSGQEFTNTIEDILFHIINHSTYHRGQIAKQLRQEGNTPPATDFIFYLREGKL